MRDAAELVGTQEWLDPVAKPLDEAVGAVFQGETGRTVKDGLNGTWLGHLLHPVLTDVPIGAACGGAGLQAGLTDPSSISPAPPLPFLSGC